MRRQFGRKKDEADVGEMIKTNNIQTVRTQVWKFVNKVERK